MDYSIAARLVSALAAIIVVSLLVRRARRHAAGAASAGTSGGVLSNGLSPAFWKILVGGGVVPIAAVLLIGGPLTGDSFARQWEAKLAIALAGVLAMLVGWHYRTWRLLVDAQGLHLRRLLLPDVDLSWEEMDSVTLTDRGQGIALVAGGRKRASFPAMYIASGDDPALLREAAAVHGVPMCLEEELPDGVAGPHGLKRHGMADWKVVAIFFSAVAIGFAVLFALLQRFYG